MKELEKTLNIEEIDSKMELQRLAMELDDFTENLKSQRDIDQRWLAIAITDLQKGFMELRRAMWKREGF